MAELLVSDDGAQRIDRANNYNDDLYAIWSMYGIFTYTYTLNQPPIYHNSYQYLPPLILRSLSNQLFMATSRLTRSKSRMFCFGSGYDSGFEKKSWYFAYSKMP